LTFVLTVKIVRNIFVLKPFYHFQRLNRFDDNNLRDAANVSGNFRDRAHQLGRRHGLDQRHHPEPQPELSDRTIFYEIHFRIA
jgi:hypothetical protein